ncbi:hypothetical protein [Alishewanella tabrizica]|uniref:Lipoprotein n=1 Tax=Alishewanella tabrizica TaxID=671278 RepID=A0ABQ2WJD0_9ALTE|nr:hypothetical protein [Alishewanella tabrizica]GGW59551.1 hypothetical protein GCM10008111_14560 [Alishewanella tabrizica]
MRWFSGLAILFYLSLLCTPQPFVVHAAQVSPQAENQLQAVQPALQQHLLGQPNEKDDPHSAALIAVERGWGNGFILPVSSFIPHFTAPVFYGAWQARAPPYSLTY